MSYALLDDKKAKGIKRGHIWSYVGNEEGRPIRAVYDHAPDWSGKGPRTFLATRRGYIQGDGYKGIDELFKNPEAGVRRVGCWATRGEASSRRWTLATSARPSR